MFGVMEKKNIQVIKTMKPSAVVLYSFFYGLFWKIEAVYFIVSYLRHSNASHMLCCIYEFWFDLSGQMVVSFQQLKGIRLYYGQQMAPSI